MRKKEAPFPQSRSVLPWLPMLQDALAMVRGPFLDGFWLGEDAPFGEWVQQRQYWQARLVFLLDRLSFL